MNKGEMLTELLAQVREGHPLALEVFEVPPGNRDPYPDEIALYAPFLDRQIRIIQPKVIVTLGRFAMAYVMDRYGLGEKIEGISKIHGNSYPTKLDYGEVLIVPMFHPAVAAYNGETKNVLEKDFQRLREQLLRAGILNSP